MPKFYWLISCEHGGNELPPEYAPLFAGQEDLLDSHQGWDPGALELGHELAVRLKAPFFYNTTSRLLVDCNRSATNPAVFSTITKALPLSERQDIIRRYHQPHRARIATAIAKELAGGRHVLHLAVHSFTPILAGKTRNADMGLLYDSRRQEESTFCQHWQKELRRQHHDLHIRRNYPYLGRTDGLATWLRRQHPSPGYIGIEVEINQLLTTDQASNSFIAGLLTKTIKALPAF